MFWGVDVGSIYAKIAGIDDKRNIIDTAVIPTIVNQDDAVKEYLKDKPVEMLVATGYGRYMIENALACPAISEIKAHAKGSILFCSQK